MVALLISQVTHDMPAVPLQVAPEPLHIKEKKSTSKKRQFLLLYARRSVLAYLKKLMFGGGTPTAWRLARLVGPREARR